VKDWFEAKILLVVSFMFILGVVLGFFCGKSSIPKPKLSDFYSNVTTIEPIDYDIQRLLEIDNIEIVSLCYYKNTNKWDIDALIDTNYCDMLRLCNQPDLNKAIDEICNKIKSIEER